MHINISLYAIILIALIFLAVCVGFGNSKPLRICYIIITSIFATIGLLVMVLLRPLLVSTLKKNLESGRLESDSIAWVINKYDTYAITSIILTCFICMLIIVLLYITRKNKKGLVWNSVTSVVYISRILLIFAALVYSYGTINKLFDIASYITTIAIAETLVLYIPIVVRRIALIKE